MSHEILKYASFNKKEKKIMVTVACNNCRPLTFSKCEYSVKDMTYEQNIEYFFVDMLNGSIQGGQKKVKDIYTMLKQAEKVYAPNTDFEVDLRLKTGRNNGLHHLVAKLIAVPEITGEGKRSQKEIAEAIRNYDAESIRVYDDLRKEYKEKSWELTGACARSDIYPGFNVFVKPEDDSLIIAEHACYIPDHPGFCDTTKGKSINLGKGTSHLFHMASAGYVRTFEQMGASAEARAEMLKAAEYIRQKMSEIGVTVQAKPFFPEENVA